jgi:methionyl-tRNA formyltransferase
MRVVFFGLPLAALLLHEDGVDVALAVMSRPHGIGARRLAKLLGPERVRARKAAETPGFSDEVTRAAPDLLVSWFWTRRIPPDVLAAAPLGAVGVHPSLLPRHRGPDPYFWAIESGDDETGVTAHRLDATYDTGPILAQRRLVIDPAWDAWTLARRLDRPSLAVLREVVRGFARGSPPPAIPQDEAQATLAPEPDERLLGLSFRVEAARVVRRVRAAAPWPGAFTEIGDALATVTRARVTSDYPRALLPGEAAVRSDGVAVIRTADAAVELLAGRDEDGATLDVAALAGIVRRTVPPPAETL